MLTGQAKRDWVRQKRAKVRQGSTGSNKPTLDELRELMGFVESSKPTPVRPPLYNILIHRPGDRVLVQQGKRLIETIIPELDASGNPIPEY